MEEAQQVAQDFISSLDNVPLEVKFLLEEISQKEKQAQELQRLVNNKILRANPRVPGGQAHKELNFDTNIQPDIDKIESLADDRVELAERLLSIITRHCGRLEYDINRVRVAAGETPIPNAISTPAFDSGVPAIALRGNNISDTRGGLVDVTRTGSISLTAAGSISIPESVPSPPATASMAGPAQKRRRLAGGSLNTSGTVTNNSVVLSQVPPPPRQPRTTQSNVNTNGAGARPSPPVQSSRRGVPSRPLQTHSDDATGDDHEDDPTDPEDKQLYCFCRKLSYGEMIACDNDDCHYQWFHLPCVGIKPPLPEKWYCSECRTLMGHSDGSPPGTTYGGIAASTASQATERGGRKGRKK
ncbi:Histone acetyltransferase complex subunit [Tulasnella sp. 427]|nr:Histone acetyltransferase complex subunit [Tulasnella sp. 427]